MSIYGAVIVALIASILYLFAGIYSEVAFIEFDEKGLKYHSTDYGVTIIIPENAVSGKARLRMGVSLVGPFCLPKNYRLVSAVFWLDISVHLKKFAELHMPHFVRLQNEEDTKRLSFFLATDQSITTTGEYQFTRVQDYPSNFKPGSGYGTLWADHFCSGCIAEEMKESSLPLQYRCCLTGVTPESCDYFDGWQIDFVFSYALQSCYKVSQHYSKYTIM